MNSIETRNYWEKSGLFLGIDDYYDQMTLGLYFEEAKQLLINDKSYKENNRVAYVFPIIRSIFVQHGKELNIPEILTNLKKYLDSETVKYNLEYYQDSDDVDIEAVIVAAFVTNYYIWTHDGVNYKV